MISFFELLSGETFFFFLAEDTFWLTVLVWRPWNRERRREKERKTISYWQPIKLIFTSVTGGVWLGIMTPAHSRGCGVGWSQWLTAVSERRWTQTAHLYRLFRPADLRSDWPLLRSLISVISPSSCSTMASFRTELTNTVLWEYCWALCCVMKGIIRVFIQHTYPEEGKIANGISLTSQ